MSKSSRQYLVDLRAYAAKVAHFSSGGREAFYADEMIQFAIIRAYEVIGEIAKHLPTDLLAQQPQIEWQDIKEFRDFLAHNYDRVRIDIVWGAVEKLPTLIAAIDELLASLPPEHKPDN